MNAPTHHGTDFPRQAMVLAAGHGTRLRPLTDRLPKCMIPIAGKPLLQYGIEWLSRFGVREIMINVSYLADVVTDHFGDGSRWNVQITYSREAEPLGTAGGVKHVAAFFEGPFFVWYGDNLSNCRLDRLWEFHRAQRALTTLSLCYREDPTPCGIVGFDESHRIVRFLEKPRPHEVFSHWVNAAIFVLDPEVLDSIPSGGTPDFGRDVFPTLLAHGAALYGYPMPPGEQYWWVDTLADLERVCRDPELIGRIRTEGLE